MKIPHCIVDFCKAIRDYGGQAYITGGWVRDYLLNRESVDFDIEVYGYSGLGEFLEYNYVVNTVGEAYTIWKADMHDDSGKRITVDISLPRIEKRSAPQGHKNFEVVGNPFLDPKDGCRRRDFTINAMLFDPLTEEISDFYGGRKDLENKIIRAVDPETFVEDSLRVLRAMQFAARFNFSVDPETVKLCQSVDLSDLPAERLWGEVEKWFLSKYPSVGMRYFFELGIDRIFSIDAELDKEWRERLGSFIGKSMDFFLTCKGRPSHNGYKQALFLCFLRPLFSSTADLESFLDKLKVYTIAGYNVRKKVLDIDIHNVVPYTDTEIRRESTKKDLSLFFDLKICNYVVLKKSTKALIEAEDRAFHLKCLSHPLEPLLTGKHVLELGVPEGKKVGEICKAVFELQLDGKINTLEEAVEEAKKHVRI